MYLSRLLLNPRSRQVQRETADLYQRHRTIMGAFPKTLSTDERVLHRLETNPRTGQMMLLVQSQTMPEWGYLTDKSYLLPDDPFSGLANPAIKPFTLSLQPDQILKFRLCANPSLKKVRRDENGKRRNSNRVPLVHEDKQLAWLQQKGELHGFLLLQATVSQQTRHKGWKQKGSEPLTLYTIQFDGLLRVTDPDTLLEAIKNGIGPARAFGCGPCWHISVQLDILIM